MSSMLKIYGIPKYVDPFFLAEFELALKQAMADVSELALKPQRIYVHFVNCGLRPASGSDIRMEVASLLAKPERTEEVLQRAVDGIRDVFKRFLVHFPRCEYFEVTLQTVGAQPIGVSACWEAVPDQEKVGGDDKPLGQGTAHCSLGQISSELTRGPVMTTARINEELPSSKEEDSAEEYPFEGIAV